VSLIYVAMLSTPHQPSLDELRGILATVVVVATYFGVFIAFLGEKMLDSRANKNTFYRRALHILVTLLFTGSVFGFNFLRDFFEFNLPSLEKIGFVMAVIVVVSAVQFILAKRARSCK
jgi:uncharacterized membrane protein